MNNKNNSGSTYNGIGFTGLLTVVFIVLKLIGVINWSWLWVLSPIWINIIFVILLTIIYFIVNVKVNKKYK